MSTYDAPTVLLIEDSPDDERLTLRAMRTSGLPLVVKVARDGAAALRVLGLDGTNTSFLPDFVLCDLKLPMTNGDAILRAVRADPRLRHLPFVIFSSSGETSDRERCLNAGATEFVTKPVAYEEYIACVRSLLLRGLATWRPARRQSQGSLR